MPDLSFGLFSGYVPIDSTSKELHYVAALSKGDYTKDPVIIWFNGGPGCSSMLGFLQEHGPYVMDDGTTTFKENLYTWNKEATVIYLESPAGVGFSKCPKSEECQFNDTLAASDNFVAFYNLMTTKFTDLQKNDLYLAGESYAGKYVPMLAKKIDDYITSTAGKSGVYVPNFKGFMVGNGVTSAIYDGFPATWEMAFYFGLIDSTLYYNVKNNCDLTSDDPFSPQC
jgi:serine carboxypeptidase-like clade 1